ncbi:MAG: SDR family oxidoreductase [Clostridia bacterium]|nr:SDR family oxidoreductase [Clostridia bacterium]
MKKVFITGASGGIGRAITEKFYNNGYLVYAGYFSSADEISAMKDKMPGITPVKVDVSSSASVKEAFSKINGCDILINNAGIAKSNLAMDVSDEEFDRIMKIDLYGTFYACREALSYMVKNHSGTIVNISSIWGITGASMESVYSAAKAGVIGLTKALAKEYGPSNIRVNAVAPGFIETKMNSALTAEDKEAFFSETPLMRGGTPLEVADSVYFLATESSSFITGQILTVDGGSAI